MKESYKGLKASELIQWLSQMIAEHGDCRIFSMCDYNTVGLIELFPPGEFYGLDEPLFVLSWSGVEPERNSDGSFVLLDFYEEN